MKDFKTIKLFCEENSIISSKVIDEFLLYYAAERNNLEHEMDQRFESYKHITRKFQKEWINRLKAQYIAHKVFKKDGLIKSYLSHTALKELDIKERNWLKFQAEQPWRFSFSVIKNRPAESFFIMQDVFSDQEFLLYSPGVTNTLKDQSVILWLNLIAYNGACWQSFGPIGGYKSFEPDDIFYFATELKPDIEDEQELLANLEYNPVPYMMLLSGANAPLIYNKEDQLVHVMAEYDLDTINTKSLTKSFKTEYNKGVYRLSLKRWSGPPHFSQSYFDENKKIILLSSMTDRGFRVLAEGLNEYGYNFSADPFLRVNLSMISAASDILKRKIRLNDYEDLFSIETSPADQENLDKLNTLFRLVLPDINAGREPDIEALAVKAGVDIKTARDLIKHIMGKFNEMDNRKKNR
ncbi:MAG TPA: hypothetical protein VMV77_05620 [Bacteroidales bacterium]|nr:hypothetical protein [Bacteroidales bacterium]